MKFEDYLNAEGLNEARGALKGNKSQQLGQIKNQLKKLGIKYKDEKNYIAVKKSENDTKALEKAKKWVNSKLGCFVKEYNAPEIDYNFCIFCNVNESLNEGQEYYLLIKSRYSTNFKHTMKQYLVWTKKDLQTYEPKAYGSTMDAAIATFNKVREDREEEEYIESLGAIESSKRYASKETDTLAKAKADIMKISPEAKKALESGSKLGESFGNNHPALKPFFEWFKKNGMESLTYIDINTYKGRVGFEVSASGIIGSKVKYERLLDAIRKGPKNVGGKNYEYAASFMHDTYFYYSTATKLFEVRFPVVEVIKESLTEGEFIPVKDWEAKQKKLNPAKEAKLKKALAVVDSKREAVNKFMKTYDSSDENQRIERAKLGAELAAAMSAYLEIL